MSAVKSSLIISLMLASVLPSAIAASTRVGPFGEPYRQHQPVTQDLSQIIFYRQNATVTANGGATVYVDGKMHTNLLPGGYTAFCVPPGVHTLGVRLSEFLPAAGEERVLFQTTMKGGRTYFLRVDEQALLDQPPASVRAAPGENELQQTRKQTHLLSRATSVVPCAFDYARAQPMIDYLLPAKSLFIEGTRLSQQGRDAIADVAVQIRRNHQWINTLRIIVEPPNNTYLNRHQQLEAPIRQTLIEAAIPMESIRFDWAIQPQHNMLILQVN